jgi:methylphosphotriester-DNA--protein-cysteine methyltransferase
MKHVRILILIISLVAFSAVYLSFAADFKYVGSSKSNKYHYPDCKWARKISSNNMVTFKSAQEALKAGYVPCKVCKPPAKD